MRNLSNWWLYVAFKCGAFHSDPLVFRTRSGVVIQVPRRLLHTFKEIFMDECYVRDLDPHFPEAPTIIDVGANAGYFTLFAASRFVNPRIFSFEPIPSNFGLLDHNRHNNGHCNIVCIEKAIAGYTGTVTLSYNPNDSFTTSATILGTSRENYETIDVPCMTLQDVVGKYGIEYCDLLKLDCEGAEFDVLYSCSPALLGRIKRIAMEVHGGPGPGEDINSLESYLNRSGFATRRGPVGMLWAWRPQ